MDRICLRCADAALLEPLEEAARELGLPLDMDGRPVWLEPGGKGLRIDPRGDAVQVCYGTRAAAFRALSLLPETLERQDVFLQSPRFTLNGVLVDASRNAVPKPETLYQLIRRCAAMGLNALFLYTEDTIELPDYPYFGYMRGAYTAQEIRKLDDYAARFGVELIPCIQTLAHFTAPMRWRAFDELRDIGDILLLDDDKTDRFLDALIARVRELFGSRRIHVGLDEAHMAGLGRYLDKHGCPDRADLLLRHVERVDAICRRHGFRPMMWSDTFYRIGGGGYKDDVVTPDIRRRVPPDMQLVAWDYYSAKPEDYAATLESHQRFERDILFAGGAWKWLGFAPHIGHSLERSRTALTVCAAHGVKEVILTAWGDDGAEGSLWGILPVMQLFAEASWEPAADENRLAARFAACTGLCWTDFLAIDQLHLPNICCIRTCCWACLTPTCRRKGTPRFLRRRRTRCGPLLYGIRRRLCLRRWRSWPPFWRVRRIWGCGCAALIRRGTGRRFAARGRLCAACRICARRCTGRCAASGQRKINRLAGRCWICVSARWPSVCGRRWKRWTPIWRGPLLPFQSGR